MPASLATRRSGGRGWRLAVAGALVLLGLGGAPAAVACAGEVAWDAARFDRFLDDHPWVARDLQRDPTLANDDGYLDEHRSLREFLDGHPDVRRALRADPHAVLRHQHRIVREERSEREITRDEMERFDRFMRDHPAVAHDLRGDPSLVNRRAYLADHPGLHDFLRDHPTIRQELQANPYAFLRHWERYTRRAEHERGGAPR